MKNLLFILLGITIFMSSCNEDVFISGDSEKESKISTRSKGDGMKIQGPKVGDDILIFKDADHFYSVYKHLDEALKLEEDSYDDEVLKLLGNFPSVRNKLLNQEFEDSKSAYKPFLSDPVMATILNNDFEMIVDGMYIVQMNEREVVQLDLPNKEGREAVKLIEKGVPVDIDELPEGVYIGTDTDEEILSRSIFCGCSINFEQFNCTSIRITGRCKAFWSDTKGTITIVANDGFPQEFTVNGNYEIELDFPNEPFNTVTLDVNALAKCALASDNNSAFEAFSLGVTCDLSEVSTGWEWIENNGQGILAKTSNYRNWFASYESAQMYSFAWNPGGYSLNKAKLEVSIDAKRRNFFCNEVSNESETRNCNNCRFKVASVNAFVPIPTNTRHCTGEVIGDFYKRKSSVVVTAEQAPEYECCM